MNGIGTESRQLRRLILAKVNSLSTWKKFGQHAPHKPLLLLVALARIRQGFGRIMSYCEIEELLATLLLRYGPKSQNVHPEYPFSRLQHDDLWEIINPEGLSRRRSNSDPKRSELIAKDVRGGLPSKVYEALRRDPGFLQQVVESILNKHFPKSLHSAILNDIGLSFRATVSNNNVVGQPKLTPQPRSEFEVDKLYRRRDLHDRFGGQRQGGISTPANAPIVMIFASPGGAQHGYTDGWRADHKLYLYTGEGQVGDMHMIRGNSAIRDHEQNRRELHLFHAASKGYVRYMGRMKYTGHERRKAPDSVGKMRSVIVFKLALLKSNIEIPDSSEIGFNPNPDDTHKLNGFEADSGLITAIERHAAELARGYFQELGYKVRECEKQFDLCCSRASESLLVKVEGSQTDGFEIILTVNEVTLATQEKKELVLFLVSKIQLSRDNGTLKTRGGKIRVIRPWKVDCRLLTPLSYRYELSGTLQQHSDDDWLESVLIKAARSAE